MKHWRKLLSFLLIHLLLAEATNPRKTIYCARVSHYTRLSTACSNEECYILLERDLNNTQQQILSINNSLEETSLHLTATLQLLDDTTATVDDTYQYAQYLNATEALLLNTYNSVRDGLAASQEQIYNLSDMLTLISSNATYIDMTSSEAVVIVNQTIEHIVMAAETLDEVEATLLPMIESVATSIAERNDNGTELYADLMMQLSLVTSQASQLFNISWSSLNIINATIESLIDSSALQNDVSADITMQTVASETIRNQTESLSNELTSIQQMIRFYTVYISEIKSTQAYQIPSMDQLNQELQQAVQLTEDVMMLLQNISVLTNLTYDLYAAFSSYEESYQLFPGHIQTLEQDAYTLYNCIALLNQNASMASQEADQLITQAQYLQMVLQNFSGFVDTATEVLQSVEAIQMSAMDTINTANNISDMIMETCQTANDTLLALMQSSDLAESIEMVSEYFIHHICCYILCSIIILNTMFNLLGTHICTTSNS